MVLCWRGGNDEYLLEVLPNNLVNCLPSKVLSGDIIMLDGHTADLMVQPFGFLVVKEATSKGENSLS